MKWVLALAVLAGSARAELAWAPRTAAAIPANAVMLDRAAGTMLCRARLADGNMHPGAVERGSCAVPQKGKVERLAEFDVATGGTAEWIRDDWSAATIVGRQGRSDLYVCRAPVRVGGASVGWAYGKAYRDGPHARHCYAAFQDREVDVPGDFEVLRVGPRAAHAP